jgi:hypothetical protein
LLLGDTVAPERHEPRVAAEGHRVDRVSRHAPFSNSMRPVHVTRQ